MKFIELKEHIKAHKFFPVYVLTGEDGAVVKLAREQFLRLIELPDFNVSYAKEGELLQCAEVLPLGGAFRIVFGDIKQLGELGDKYLNSPNPSTIIILTGELGKAKLKEGIQIVDCGKLEAGLLAKVIGVRAKEAGVGIDLDAAHLLIEYASRLLSRIELELEKLIGFCGAGAVIGVDSIKAMVSPDLEYKVFELSDAIVRGDKERAMRMLHDMLNEGAGAAQKVFGLLYGHFRRLLFVGLGGDNLADKLGVKDFAVTVARRQADKFSKAKLKSMVDALHEIDYGIKNGKMGDRAALESFVLGV